MNPCHVVMILAGTVIATLWLGWYAWHMRDDVEDTKRAADQNWRVMR